MKKYKFYLIENTDGQYRLIRTSGFQYADSTVSFTDIRFLDTAYKMHPSTIEINREPGILFETDFKPNSEYIKTNYPELLV